MLIDTLGSVNAADKMNMTLTNGVGNSGGSNLASDSGSTITINTGLSQFVIRKSGFNLLDQVVTNGKTLVSPGHSGGLVWIDDVGTNYYSRYDNPNVAISENGPVKAVIKVEGRFKTSSGSNAPMGYTVFLTFYKNMASVKTGLTLRNAYDAVYSRAAFKAFELVLPTALGSGKSFTFAAKTGNQGGSLSATEQAYIYQGYTKHKSGGDFWQWSNTIMEAPTDKLNLGVRMVKNSTILKDFSGDQDNDYALGWGELKDSTNAGISIAYQDMDANFPSAIEFAGDGTATVGLFSKRNTKLPIVFDWATHESRDLLLDFHTTTANDDLINARLQTPLFGRAPFQQYRDSGAFLGETRIASYQEQQTIYQDNGKSGFTIPNQARQVIRVWDSSQGGTDNQRDWMLANQLDYVRIGHGGQMLNSLQRAMFVADQFAWRSDDFNFAEKSISYFQNAGKTGKPFNGAFNKQESDYEHIWVYGLYTSYYFTGDERYKHGALDLADSAYSQYLTPGGDVNIFSRLGISAARMATLSYMFDNNQPYLDRLNRYVITFLNQIDQYPGTPNVGRSNTRGYIVPSPTGSTQLVSSLFTTTYYPGAIVDILRHTPPNHVFTSPLYPGLSFTKEDLADALEGLAYFYMKEAYVYPQSGKPYIQYLYDTLNYVDPGSGRVYDTGMGAAMAFELSGDTQFLTLGAKLAVNVDKDQAFVSNSEIGNLRLLYDIQNQSQTHVGFLPLNVTNNGSGSYTLSWTAPSGASKYQVKFASRPIVPNLNYNKNTKAFQYNPSQYTAFWAANNVPNEPLPASPGSIQSMTLSGLSCGSSCNFVIRYQHNPASSTIPPSSTRLPSPANFHVE
ncbi:MAG: hypothetical protein DMG05_16905 [Acidobacteria bacterium]|nr:MAG: hypothetical protein DMG05_16905 [Acidobacteriota bacterium]